MSKEVLNEKKLMFFQDFTGNVRKVFNEDIVKYNVLSWIIFNTNYSNEYQGLNIRECYFSYSTLEEKLDITRYKLQKIMKELENERFIEWVSKSKSKGQSSILKLNLQYGLKYSSQYGSQYGSNTENTSIYDNSNTVDNMVNNMDNRTLSKKHISKKQSNNIYTSPEDEDSISYFERINKEIDDLETEINNKYDKDLIQKEKDKLISKSLSGLPLLKKLKKELENSKKKIKKEHSNEEIKAIFDCWNSKGIIKHKTLSPVIKKSIEKALKVFKVDEVVQAINIYSEILNSKFYFNYKWSLSDFLNRKNGISTFMDEGSNKANYEAWKRGDNKNEYTQRYTNKPTKRFTEGSENINYKPDEYKGPSYTEEDYKRMYESGELI